MPTTTTSGLGCGRLAIAKTALERQLPMDISVVESALKHEGLLCRMRSAVATNELWALLLERCYFANRRNHSSPFMLQPPHVLELNITILHTRSTLHMRDAHWTCRELY